MIVTEKQARYHLAYLKSLKPIRQGHYDNEVLNDGYCRVLLSRMTTADGAEYDNQVTIETQNKIGPDWRIVCQYPADTGPGYCVPGNYGLASTPAKVARRITEALTALSLIDNITTGNIQDGQIVQDCDGLRIRMMHKLIAQGWRIRATDNGWKVLPPLANKRNDNHECDGVTC